MTATRKKVDVVGKIVISELERFIEQLSNHVDELVEQVQSNPIDSESEVQLREISKAIERLESSGISIPAVLLDEKSRLLSIVGSNKSNHDQAISIYNRGSVSKVGVNWFHPYEEKG